MQPGRHAYTSDTDQVMLYLPLIVTACHWCVGCTGCEAAGQAHVNCGAEAGPRQGSSASHSLAAVPLEQPQT